MNPTRSRSARLLSSVIVIVSACSDGENVSSSGGAGGADAGPQRDASAVDAPAGDPNVVVGNFAIQLVGPSATGPGYTQIAGRVQDGPTPSQVIWETQAVAGDCRLLVPRVPFCASPCAGGVCVENDTCRAYPVSQGVGAVQVTGVRTSTGESAFALTLVSNAYQFVSEASLPYPAFAEGDTIRVSAAGSGFASAFALETRGIAPLVLDRARYPVESEMPLALGWAAPSGAAAAEQQIRVRLDISHHGGTRGKIECSTADDGALSIDAGLVSRLVSLGVAGFPTVVVSRVRTGAAVIRAGRVELNVSHEVEVPVDIPNLRSCNSDTDCTSGACRADRTCG